jgi:hypothetical protein
VGELGLNRFAPDMMLKPSEGVLRVGEFMLESSLPVNDLGGWIVGLKNGGFCTGLPELIGAGDGTSVEVILEFKVFSKPLGLDSSLGGKVEGCAW